MTTCSRCGALRRGPDLSAAAGRFYCHSLYDEYPTCYQTAVLGVEDDAPVREPI